MREFFRTLVRKARQYRWVMWTIGAIGAILRLAWFIFSHYGWLVGLAVMISAAIGDFYSPKITRALVVGLLAFAAIRALSRQASPGGDQRLSPASSRTGPSKPAVNYAAWDGINPLKIWQAATLWSGFDPNAIDDEKVPENSIYLTRLKQEVLYGRMKFKGEMGNYVIQQGDPDWVPNNLIVTRAELKACAGRFDEKPLFLFPEERK